MSKLFAGIVPSVALTFLVGCNPMSGKTADKEETKAVQRQQSQFQKGQPIPAFDWSLERDLMIQLYVARNQKVVTHSVWRGALSTVEGDCPSYGYGLPYDVSLTNPLAATDIDTEGEEHNYQGGALATIEQPEPNGIFASKNTSATWVMCLGADGGLEPVYTESSVTVYPGPVKVDYATNRVTRSGAANILLRKN